MYHYRLSIHDSTYHIFHAQRTVQRQYHWRQTESTASVYEAAVNHYSSALIEDHPGDGSTWRKDSQF